MTALPPSDAPCLDGERAIIIRDFETPARLGVHAHEKNGPQMVRINLQIAVPDATIQDRIDQVTDYETLVADLRAEALRSHVALVETFAERVMRVCFDRPEVRAVRVRIEKLEALEDCGGVGVEVSRRRETTTSQSSGN